MASGTTRPTPSASGVVLPPQPPPTAYETAIDRRLERTRRQVKSVDVLVNLMTLAAGGLLYVLGVGLLDHWAVKGGLGFGTRLGLWLFLVVVGGWYAARRVIPHLLRRINPVYAAHSIEQQRPALQNSLVNFLLLRSHKEGVNQAIFQAVEQRAAVDLQAVPADVAVDHRRVVRISYVLAAVCTLVIVYFLLSPKSLWVSGQRLMWPWTRTPAPTRVTFDKIEPGDATAFHNEFLTVSAEVTGLKSDEAVVLHYTTADQQIVDEGVPLKRVGDSSFLWRATLPPDARGLQQDLDYRLIAGDARSPTFHVHVQLTPTIRVERVEYHYPAYTELSSRVVEGEEDLKALEGTEVTLHATANEEIARAEIDLDCTGKPGLRMSAQGTAATGKLTLRLKPDDRSQPEYASYQLRFVDRYKRDNPQPIRHRIEVLPDEPPQVQFVSPEEPEIALVESGRLEIRVRAVDPDFALRRVALEAEVRGKRLTIPPLLEKRIPDDPHKGEFVGTYRFEPAKLGLKEGTQVTYWAVAEDNKTDAQGEAAPNRTETARRQIEIVRPGAGGQGKPGQQGAAPNQPGKSGDPNEAPPEQPNAPDWQKNDPKNDRSQQSGNEKQNSKSGAKDERQDQSPQGSQQQGQNEGEQQMGGGSQGGGDKNQAGAQGNQKGNEAGGPGDKQPGGDQQAGDNQQPVDGNSNPGDAFDRMRQWLDKLQQKNQGQQSAQPQNGNPNDQQANAQPQQGQQQPGQQQPGQQQDQQQGQQQTGQQQSGQPQQSGTPSAKPDGQGQQMPGQDPQKQQQQQQQQQANAGQPQNKGGQSDQQDKQTGQPGQSGRQDQQGQGQQGQEKQQGQPAAQKPQPGQQSQPGQPDQQEAADPADQREPMTPGEKQAPGKGQEMAGDKGGTADQATGERNRDGSKTPGANDRSAAKPDGMAQSGDKQGPGSDTSGGTKSPDQQTADGQKSPAKPDGQTADASKPGGQSAGDRQGTPGGLEASSRAPGEKPPTQMAQNSQPQGDPANKTARQGEKQATEKEPGERVGEPKESTPQAGQGDKTRAEGMQQQRPDAKPDTSTAKPDATGGDPEQSAGQVGQGRPSNDNTGSPSPQEKNQARQQKSPPNAQPETDRPGNSDEGKSPTTSPKQSSSQGDASGDRSGGGEQGGGQKANQSGMGQPGTHSAAEQGGSPSNEKGAGETGSKSGDQAKSDRSTGQENSARSDKGSETQSTQTQQPGSGSSAADNQAKSSDAQPSPDGKAEPSQNAQASGNSGSPMGGSSSQTPGAAPDAAAAGANEPGGDDPNLEYAAKQTDLVLEKLREQLAQEQPDRELLDRLGWTREDLARFYQQWEQMRRAAAQPGPKGETARDEFRNALKSLGIRPPATALKGGQVKRDQQQGLTETQRIGPPPAFAPLLKAYTEGVSGQR